MLGEGFTPLVGQLEVTVHCYVQRPKTTKLPSPRGDIDNFAKAVLDAMNGKLWDDDKQIESLHVHKTWTEGPEIEGYFTVTTKEI